MATRRSAFTVNKRRKGPLALVMPWLKRFGIVLAIAIAAFWAGSWFWLSGSMARTQGWLTAQAIAATADAGFTVNNILVEGRVYTDPELLRAIINTGKGQPLFAFNPQTAREQIRQINWVQDAHVERRLPDTIYIGLIEKKPLALWQKNNVLELLDEEGRPVTKENLGRFKNLLIVMGDDAPPHAPDLVKNLGAEPEILRRIRAAKWMGGRRWDLVFDNAVTAMLPEGETGLALRRLGDAIRNENLLEKDILSVDLREEGRMIVQTAPGAAQAWQASVQSEKNI